MTLGGWIIMLLSVGLVTGLFLVCLTKVLKGGAQTSEHLHGFEMETPDERESDSQ